MQPVKINKTKGLVIMIFWKCWIKPRIAGDFDKLQAIDIGAKIQLSEKKFEELFKTKVGDKTYINWLKKEID